MSGGQIARRSSLTLIALAITVLLPSSSGLFTASTTLNRRSCSLSTTSGQGLNGSLLYFESYQPNVWLSDSEDALTVYMANKRSDSYVIKNGLIVPTTGGPGDVSWTKTGWPPGQEGVGPSTTLYSVRLLKPGSRNYKRIVDAIRAL